MLSNLFLHYAFDVWMVRHQADIRFERYADDSAPRTQERRFSCRTLRECDAVSEMKAGPSEAVCRGSLQTTLRGCGQQPWS